MPDYIGKFVKSTIKICFRHRLIENRYQNDPRSNTLHCAIYSRVVKIQINYPSLYDLLTSCVFSFPTCTSLWIIMSMVKKCFNTSTETEKTHSQSCTIIDILYFCRNLCLDIDLSRNKCPTADLTPGNPPQVCEPIGRERWGLVPHMWGVSVTVIVIIS